MFDYESQIRAEMERHGIVCNEAIERDGRIHRFRSNGETKKNAWYKFFTDEPAVCVFGHHKLYGRESLSWKADVKRDLTPEEKEKWKKHLASERQRKFREEQHELKQAMKKSNEVWSVSAPNPADHAYVLRKRIQPHAARRYQGQTHVYRRVEIKTGDLVIPVKRKEELIGLQLIKEDGLKLFLPGTKKEGSYCHLGPAPQDVLVICEGYATGATIHEATALPVFVLWDCYNLVPTVKSIRATYPDARIIIAADDDWKTVQPPNPGITEAGKAAALINAEIARPRFQDGREEKWTDFNDLAAVYGIAEVASQILTGKPTFETKSESPMVSKIADSILLEPLPDQLPGKAPLSTIRNLESILERAGCQLRYNVISKREEHLIPGEEASTDNRETVVLARIKDMCRRFKMPVTDLKEYLVYLADKYQYNPVKTWVESKPWDGCSRINDLCATLVAKNEKSTQLDESGEEIGTKIRHLKQILITRWLISAVAAALRPRGVSAHGILVLQGDQYIGKTKWFKQLVPAELGLDVIAEGKSLDPDNKDSILQVISHWIVELGEINSTFRKADIDAMKNFLTRDHDMLRVTWNPRESRFARRTVFFGSVNPDKYLVDETGNRRYWTIACESIDHSHNIDMQQLWAEIAVLFQQGESWFLTTDELKLLNEHNRAFESGDHVKELIHTMFNWTAPEVFWTWQTSAQIIATATNNRYQRAELNRVKKIVLEINGHREKIKRGITYLFVPPAATEETKKTY